jgi:Tfp pilus assembly protein PilO
VTNEATEVQTPARREQIRLRLTQLRNSRQRKVLGIAEIAGLAGAGLLLLLAAVSYFYFLAPARARREALEQDRTRLQAQYRNAQVGYQHTSDIKTIVETINASLQQFEDRHLVARDTGRMSLYTELNQLMRSNNLRNTAGPAYSALAPLGAKQSANDNNQQGNAKWQSVFPGIGVSVTVEGTYQNLRHFLRDIESSRQFLIINTVEFENTSESNVGPLNDADLAGRLVAKKPSLVSLRLDMATYFQRGATESGATANESMH